jgi:hypothetical protein
MCINMPLRLKVRAPTFPTAATESGGIDGCQRNHVERFFNKPTSNSD